MKDGIKFNGNILNYCNLCHFLFSIIIFTFLAPIKISGENLRHLIDLSSEIHLIIKGSGNQSLVSNEFNLEPSEVVINGIRNNLCKKYCELENDENNVTLYFNDNINTLYKMFFQLENIKEIDLSNTAFSDLYSMSYMFYNCSGLEKINFGNINTSTVKYMTGLFYNCSSLTYLNLSSFNTSSLTTMELMFYHCTNLKEIDLSNFNTKNVETLRSTFYSCSSLTSIDISNFDTSKVNSIAYLFRGCSNLRTINLGNMNTSSVKDMKCLFYDCINLETIDITSFDSSLVTSMGWMFYNCISLKSIFFPDYFNTSQDEVMYSMFCDCKSLIYLNLSTFDTSKVTQMCHMFNDCNNLKYLDISNFSPLNITIIDGIFCNMSSLVYLNIYSLEINNSTNKTHSFSELPRETKICSNEYNMMNYIAELNIINNCSDICFKKNIKLGNYKNECINSCKDNGLYYECNNICYQECPEGTYPIIQNISNKDNISVEFEDGIVTCLDKQPEGYYLDEYGFYERCFENCLFCYGPGNHKENNCSKCKSNFRFLEEDIYTNNCFEKCPYYYYFNETNDYICTETENCTGIYDKLIIDKNKCIDKCENDNIFKYEYDKICYEKCPEGTFYNEENKICLDEKNLDTTFLISEKINYDFISNIRYSTTINYSNEIIQTSSDNTIINNTININNINHILTISSDNSNIESSINSFSYDEEQSFSQGKDSLIIKETTTRSQAILLTDYKEITQFTFNSKHIYKTNFLIKGNNEDVYKKVMDDFFSNYDITNGEEMIFEGEDNFFFHITNSENEINNLKGKNNNTNKFSVIDLGECGNLLKKHYHINQNISLIIVKFEKLTNKSSERSLQYEVYEPYNKTKLNLSICENVNIDIYVPLVLSEKTQNLYDELKELGYDLFDINSPFYQDICTPYKSSNGTDVSLNDRVNYFYNNEETTCQSNCKFSDYLMESQYLKCDCDIVSSDIDTKNTKKFDAKKIYQSFFQVLKYSNYKVLKCSKLTLSINSVTKNFGSILTIVYFLIYCTFLFIYICK